MRGARSLIVRRCTFPRPHEPASSTVVASIMQPTISRETVLIDRRQPKLRWSAVFAGAICSIGFWILLQLIGVGIGLASVEVDDIQSLRGAGVGTTVWSLISPLIAMFFGGLIAGKLSQTYDRKVAGAHGLVMWALTAIVGLVATISIVAAVAQGAMRHRRVMLATDPWGQREPAMNPIGVDTGELLGPINDRLAAQRKPTITEPQLDAALRGVVRSGIARGNFDQELLIDQLVANTRLSRADAAEIERQIEAQLDISGTQPHAVEHRAQRAVLDAADATGKALATAGFSLLLSLIAAVGGAMLALRRPRRHGEGTTRTRSTTDPGYAPSNDPVTTTSPYPTPMTGPATPVVPPRDITP
jgi:hypothetical protein